MAVHGRGRWLCGSAAALLAGLGGLAGCDNGAVGVDACREIETARCQLVLGCPNTPVETEEDVENCELHYRDQCLFGMADSANPDQPAVAGCIAAIELSRACWDAGQTLGECNAIAVDAGTGGPTLATGIDPALTGCDAIMFPQILQACSFLAPPAEEAPSEGTGGDTGSGGSGG